MALPGHRMNQPMLHFALSFIFYVRDYYFYMSVFTEHVRGGQRSKHREFWRGGRNIGPTLLSMPFKFGQAWVAVEPVLST